MATSASLYEQYAALKRRHEIQADLVFVTSWRIGSGREGETGIDLGVLLGPDGQPLLPGSSLKGKLRSLCETLAPHLGMSACQLQVKVSNVKCISDTQYYKEVRDSYERVLGGSPEQQLEWIETHTCDVCKLFGSPLRSSRVKVSDGILQEGTASIYRRDGVVLDRDSRTAVDRLKYDYEVVGPGARYRFMIKIENASDKELALIGAALFQMADGEAMGGFVSRGLGRFRLDNIRLWEADFTNKAGLVDLLTGKTRGREVDWEQFFSGKIQAVLARGAENAA